mgnify:CR=1 FL=1
MFKRSKKNLESLVGKVAVITGGSSGIGYAVAKKLLSLGARVVLIGREQRRLEKAVGTLGSKSSFLVADITDRAEVESVGVEIERSFHKIDFLVNCAGMSAVQNRGVIDEQVFEELLKVNLTGTYICSMIFGYKLIKRGGAVVNISSIRGRSGTPSFSPGYAAAKAGVINLTKSFALELAKDGIRVNCVAPGPTYPTGISKNWTEEFIKNLSATIPMQRLAEPKEVADAVYFLLSDLSTYITGQTLDVNGGLWMN